MNEPCVGTTSIVINSGANTVLVGTNLNMQTRLISEKMNQIAKEGKRPAQTLMEIAEFYYNFYIAEQAKLSDGRPLGCGMHLPLAIDKFIERFCKATSNL